MLFSCLLCRLAAQGFQAAPNSRQLDAPHPPCTQVAPLLGIVGRPLTDAAAAAECFEGEDLPAPPPAVASAAMVASGCQHLGKACTPGLLMPEVEALLPSDHTRHTHEMQVGDCCQADSHSP